MPATGPVRAAAGLARGAYHYFSLCKPGREQAVNFLEVLPEDRNMLAPVLDLEFTGNCARTAAGRRRLEGDIAFSWPRWSNRQQRAKQVILYAPEEFYAAYLKGQGNQQASLDPIDLAFPVYTKDWVALAVSRQRHGSRGFREECRPECPEHSEAAVQDLKSLRWSIFCF